MHIHTLCVHRHTDDGAAWCCMHACKPMILCTHSYTRAHTHMNLCTHTHTRTHTHMNLCTHSYTRTRTHTHMIGGTTRTRAQPKPPKPAPGTPHTRGQPATQPTNPRRSSTLCSHSGMGTWALMTPVMSRTPWRWLLGITPPTLPLARGGGRRAPLTLWPTPMVCLAVLGWWGVEVCVGVLGWRVWTCVWVCWGGGCGGVCGFGKLN
jgi:hypothetical protein